MTPESQAAQLVQELGQLQRRPINSHFQWEDTETDAFLQ